jgi:hypothetical protein
MLEINKSTGGELRLTYNDANGSATDYCDFVTDANGGLTVTTVDSDGAAGHINFNPDGNVGVKTATPITEFQVTGTTTSTKINLGGGLTEFILNGVALDAVVGSTSQIATELQYIGIQHSNIALAGARFMLSRSRGTLATPLIVQDGDSLAAIDAAAFDGTDYVLAAQIDFEIDGAPGANDMPGRIVFKTTVDGGVLPTERLRIDSTGNVGIGETDPQDTLELNGTMLIKDALKFTQDDGNENIDSAADGYLDYTATTAHRFNTLIEASGDVVFIGAGSGLPYGCMSGIDETITCTDQSTYYQVTFDTAGPSNLTTVSIANEEITVLKTGIYDIAVTACLHSAVSHDFELLVKKNDGATELEPHLYQTTAVANQVENTAGSCIVSLTANDRIELWIQCTDAAGQDVIFDHVSLTCAMHGG